MPDIDDLDFGSDEEVSQAHSALIKAVNQLDGGQRVKKIERSEPSIEVSEFHLVRGDDNKSKIRIRELAQSLGKKGEHIELSKKLKAAQQKAQTLRKPLERPAAERVKRIVGYKNTQGELSKWEAIVTKNRVSEDLRFPLNQPTLKFDNTSEFVQRFTMKSELEKKLAELDPVEPVEDESDDKYPLTLQEILERRREVAKFRAQQSYKESKAHRQNKIKSKKFHRRERNERIKREIKEFEELQKTDPEAALKKLEELDKARAEERMSLRHKSTGQWAKSKQVRAKYDRESRQVLAQQLAISRDLTQKVRKAESSDEEEEIGNGMPVLSDIDKDNPWVSSAKSKSEIDNFISGYRKYWDGRNKAHATRDSQECVTDTCVIVDSQIPEKKPQISSSTDESSINVNGDAKGDSGLVNGLSEKNGLSKKSKKRPTSSDSGKIDALKSKKSKKVKREIVTSSSGNWTVTSVEVNANGNPKRRKNLEDIDIDDMFDDMNDEITRRCNEKLQSLKKQVKDASGAKNHKKGKKGQNSDVDEPYLGFRNQKKKVAIDEELNETANESSQNSSKSDVEKLKGTANSTSAPQTKASAMEIDPNKFINVRVQHLKTCIPNSAIGDQDVMDDIESDEECKQERQRSMLSEAFADDDVLEEFQKEKDDEVKKSLPTDIDTRLPGWGSWGGKDIKAANRKKRRFLIKVPKEVTRRDENKGSVIIFEDVNKAKEHQVSELPYPFTSVEDFEASIRAPIGRTFVPESAHKKLTDPAVKTRLGQIIEPMDKECLLKRNKRTGKLKIDGKNQAKATKTIVKKKRK